MKWRNASHLPQVRPSVAGETGNNIASTSHISRCIIGLIHFRTWFTPTALCLAVHLTATLQDLLYFILRWRSCTGPCVLSKASFTQPLPPDMFLDLCVVAVVDSLSFKPWPHGYAFILLCSFDILSRLKRHAIEALLHVHILSTEVFWHCMSGDPPHSANILWQCQWPLSYLTCRVILVTVV